ncbi:MAG: M3 family oligoendopeptidase, partial [Clostridiales bacterium]|nr:M3 family oligoendopeptidase [Clostridiales bacterium]
MKFSEMPYERPDYERVNERFASLLTRFKAAESLDECLDVYREYDEYSQNIESAFTIAMIRNSLNTADEFFEAEKAYIDETMPKLAEVMQEFTKALLTSPYRNDLEARWGSLMFDNAELTLKTFKPAIIEDLQKENKLVTEYDKLIASAQIDYDGKKLTLAQMRPYYERPDRAEREAAMRSAAAWYMGNSERLDSLYGELVKIRTGIAGKLGYENFVELGYYRMRRNGYDREAVAKFRDAVAKHIVPLASRLKAEQARRIGVDSIRVYDDAFTFPDGTPKPTGTPEEIFAHGKKMYHELSGETAEFIDFMLKNGLFDVLSRPGKAAGGYCATIPAYKSPFIFANFNGTSGDIDVLTHEAGHAFASHVGRD